MRDTIVVGASAGGIRALQTLMAGLPEDLAAAVIVVNHIPVDSQSALPQILSSAGVLEAKAAEDGEPLARGIVYAAPPDRHLLIERGRLRLTRGPRENRVRPSIDTLFRSAAVDRGSRVIGVVLSGVLDDGTAGLWAIKDRGGLAVVQLPDEAEYRDMPQNALTHVAVDHVLSAAEIGPVLAELAGEPAPPATLVPARMAAEARMDLHGRPLRHGVLEMGQPSPNTCPECHGSLVEIREGSISRYRCHTGHAYSLRTLLAETEVAIERSLWEATRALEERSFLLETMARRVRDDGDSELADQLARAAARDEVNAQGVRQLTTAAGAPAEAPSAVAAG